MGLSAGAIRTAPRCVTLALRVAYVAIWRAQAARAPAALVRGLSVFGPRGAPGLMRCAAAAPQEGRLRVTVTDAPVGVRVRPMRAQQPPRAAARGYYIRRDGTHGTHGTHKRRRQDTATLQRTT